MSKGRNPNRPSASQKNHDKMVKYVAENLDSQGYYVLADDINWKNGSPYEVNGYIPDIIASKGNSTFIMEIETCPTYKDDHTKSQLTAFSSEDTTYVIIPPVCIRSESEKEFDPVPELKDKLREWGLTNVKIGTCNPFTGKIKYNL